MVLGLQYFCFSYVWYFYITWLPTYLREGRGQSPARAAALAVLPLLFGGIGSLTTGLAPRRLPRRVDCIRRLSGNRHSAGRGDPHSFGVPAMLAMGLASFASDLTMPISWDACVEIGGPYCATVAASMNMLGNLGGFVAPVVGGVILARTRGNWNLVIEVMAGLAVISALCWLYLDPDAARQERESSRADGGSAAPIGSRLEPRRANQKKKEQQDMKIDLTGRTAVITGGSRGLGEAMAKALAEAGAQIALVARDATDWSKCAMPLPERGGTADVFTADVTQEKDVAAIAAAIQQRFGHPQILINNAGINIRKNLVDFTLEEWRSVIDANLTATFLMCRAFVPRHEGHRLRPHPEYDVDHEPRVDPGAHARIRQQSRAARPDARAGARTGRGRHHGERHQPRPIRDRNESALMNNPEVKRAVPRQHPGGTLGQSGRDRRAGAVICVRKTPASSPARTY